MKLIVERHTFGDTYTIGNLLVDGAKFCYTLEDVVRPANSPKVAGATAVPEGTYKLTIDHSNRFGKDMPHILDVPNFEGIRIHSGNTDKDTEGCILLGTTWPGGDFIGGSRAAFDRFFPLLKQVLTQGEVTIDVCTKV